MRPLRILWILPYLPWPTTSGGKLRQYHLLRCLAARGHRITLLVQSKVPLDVATQAQLEPLLEDLIVLQRRPLRSPRTMLAGLLSPAPLLASVNGHAPAFSSALQQLLQQSWDVVQLEHSYMYEPCRGPLQQHARGFLLSEHNVESTLAEVTYSRLPAVFRPLARLDRWRYQRWERQVVGAARKVVVLTEDDAKVLAAYSQQPIAVVVNGTDTEAFAEVLADPASGRILFVGNFEYAPNIDAVEWLLDEIMPAIWAAAPQTRLCLCGYALPTQWAERWPDTRIEWRGFVPSLQPVQAKSSLFLAALRDGGGSKLKVLEAMAAGLPVVATQQAVSGLDVQRGTHYLGGSDTAALVAAALQLLADPQLARATGEAGRDYVRAQHDWQRSADQLEAVYAELTCA
ncbi:glycosyltransferase family 4 protein [Stenotrophomonas pigmentata]|uniref:glycosyltransferase family 4 protein n=1 Tax=Stenotrophomonas pigmentata TaxID=3055080 RepID=UPI0026EF4BB4|nr:glycosyltransferase family 4 protein [Stenotrophomonas sp. 610A2]